MKIRWHNGNTWQSFSEKEIDYMGRQNAHAVMSMLSSGAPVVIEHKGKYITDHPIRKELDGACASFKAAMAKIPPNMMFKELMQ